MFAPACLVDSWSSQAFEFSAAITRCSRVHIQIVTIRASMMGDIFSLPTADTLRAFSFLTPPCLTLSNIRYVSMVKWSNPGKGVAPTPTPQCCTYWKGSDWQLFICILTHTHYIYILTFIFIYMYIYIHIITPSHITTHICIVSLMKKYIQRIFPKSFIFFWTKHTKLYNF